MRGEGCRCGRVVYECLGREILLGLRNLPRTSCLLAGVPEDTAGTIWKPGITFPGSTELGFREMKEMSWEGLRGVF